MKAANPASHGARSSATPISLIWVRISFPATLEASADDSLLHACLEEVLKHKLLLLRQRRTVLVSDLSRLPRKSPVYLKATVSGFQKSAPL